MDFTDNISNITLTSSYKLMFKKLPEMEQIIKRNFIIKRQGKIITMKEAFCDIFEMLFIEVYKFLSKDGKLFSDFLGKIYENSYYNNLFIDCIKYFNHYKNSTSSFIDIIFDINKQEEFNNFFQEIFFIIHFCIDYIKLEEINDWFNDDLHFNLSKVYNTIKENSYFVIEEEDYDEEDYNEEDYDEYRDYNDDSGYNSLKDYYRDLGLVEYRYPEQFY